METLNVSSSKREEMIDITRDVEKLLDGNTAEEGTRFPRSAKTPSAKAISVAIGIPIPG